MGDKVGTTLIVYMHALSPQLTLDGLTGATGASLNLAVLSVGRLCFTYEQRRSAASPDPRINRQVKHRRPVFEPGRGGSGRSIGRDGIGEVGLLPRVLVQLELHGYSLGTRWGLVKGLALVVLLASTNLLGGWSSV